MTKFWWKRNTNWFNKNPQNINRKWRPKKWVSFVNEELKKEGYTQVKKQDIIENYLSLINLPEEKLKIMVNDSTLPIFVRILIKNILSKKWFDIIEIMLDRAIWKATSINENINIDMKPFENITIEIIKDENKND